MKSNMEFAKDWMIEMFGEKPNVAKIRNLPTAYASVTNGKIANGMYRISFISNKRNIVVKVGRNPEGNAQCFDEEKLYKEAKEHRLGCYFSAYLGNFKLGRVQFHVYEKIPNVGSVYRLPQFEKVHTFYDWALEFVSCRAHERLENFISNKIEYPDLHRGNFGYKNGHIVIVDYAGC